MPAEFPRTRAVLDAEVAEGLFTKGAQVSVDLHGEQVLAYAVGDDGLGRDVTPRSVFRVYCTIKPIAAIAVAKLVDAGQVDLDEPLARRLPGIAALADGAVTLRHVLSHAAGLHRPTAVEVELIPPDRRAAHLAAVLRPPTFAVGTDVAYSERFAWHLVELLLEDVTGEPLREHLRTAVLDPAGMHDTWIGMTDDTYDREVHRIGLNHDMRQLQSFPLLLERGRRMCTEVNPAHGGYSTAADLTRFYRALLDRLDGADLPWLPGPDTLRTFTSPVRPASMDQILVRVCEHGLGFMTNLAQHAYGPTASPRSFGHSGNVGSSFAWADPDKDLAAAVVFNGIVDPDSAFLRRPVVVRAIAQDLELDGTAGSHGDIGADDGAPVRRSWFGRRRPRTEP